MGDPLRLGFTLDTSVIGATPINDIVPFRNGLPVAECAGPSPAPVNATPWPCVYNRGVRLDGDVEITVLTLQASEWTTGVRKAAPSLAISDVRVVEGDPSTATRARLLVTMSRTVDTPVTVGYSTAPGTAALDDFRSSSGTVVIPAGAVTAAIDVTIVGDALNEVDEVFTVRLSAPVGATIADGSGNVTIRNDDPGRSFRLPRVDAVCAATGDRIWKVRNDNRPAAQRRPTS